MSAIIWDAHTGDSIVRLTGHTAPLNEAGFSPDGSRVVTAGFDGTSRVWDAWTGQQIHSLTGHTDRVRTSRYSPDGRWIVTASFDSTGIIWDSETGELVHRLAGHSDAVLSAEFSPDSRWVVTAGADGLAIVWDVMSGQIVTFLDGHTAQVGSATFSNGIPTRVLTASSDATLRLWDMSDLGARSIDRNSDEIVRILRVESDGLLLQGPWRGGEGMRVVIVDLLGRSVYKGVAQSTMNDGVMSVNYGILPTGGYFLLVGESGRMGRARFGIVD
jgi:WD40 repeat protein